MDQNKNHGKFTQTFTHSLYMASKPIMKKGILYNILK
jgi:hypothetical protein